VFVLEVDIEPLVSLRVYYTECRKLHYSLRRFFRLVSRTLKDAGLLWIGERRMTCYVPNITAWLIFRLFASILNARKAQKEAEEQHQREMRLQEETTRVSVKQHDEARKTLLEMFPDVDPMYADMLLKEERDDLDRVAARMVDGRYPRAAPPQPPVKQPAPAGPVGNHSGDSSRAPGGSFLSNFRNRLTNMSLGPTPPLRVGGRDDVQSPMPGDFSSGRQPVSVPAPAPAPAPYPGQHNPSSLQDIRRNVLSAVAACKADSVWEKQKQTEHGLN
jgi:hypothetical protein